MCRAPIIRIRQRPRRSGGGALFWGFGVLGASREATWAVSRGPSNFGDQLTGIAREVAALRESSFRDRSHFGRYRIHLSPSSSMMKPMSVFKVADIRSCSCFLAVCGCVDIDRHPRCFVLESALQPPALALALEDLSQAPQPAPEANSGLMEAELPGRRSATPWRWCAPSC